MKDGYISKYNERNYAIKTRKLEKRDIGQHKNRDETWEIPSPVCCNSIVEGRKIKEEEIETTKEILEKTFWNPFKEKKKRKKKDDPS